MCGSCAVVVNGKEALACQTSIGALGTDVVRISPLRALPVLRDVMSDMAPFFDTLKRAEAALRPKDPNLKSLRTMPPAAPHRATIEGQNGCITCGACFSACEWSATRPGYLGPAAMNRVLMLALDERDALGKAREALVTRRPVVAQYELSDELAQETGLICGGQMEVFIDPLRPTPLLPAASLRALFSLAVALASGRALGFEPTAAYVLSLAYLAGLGSIIAFACYLTLLQRIGPARAGYIGVMVPIVALVVSAAFEGFRWHVLTFAGIAISVAGNVTVLRRREPT